VRGGIKINKNYLLNKSEPGAKQCMQSSRQPKIAHRIKQER